MKNTRTKKTKAKSPGKPLTIAIHGDGINIDATFADVNLASGIAAFVTRHAYDGLRSCDRPHEPHAVRVAPTDDESLKQYAGWLTDIIDAAPDVVTLHKLQSILNLGQSAILKRIDVFQSPAMPEPTL